MAFTHQEVCEFSQLAWHDGEDHLFFASCQRIPSLFSHTLRIRTHDVLLFLPKFVRGYMKKRGNLGDLSNIQIIDIILPVGNRLHRYVKSLHE